jgi:hypothetical protein
VKSDDDHSETYLLAIAALLAASLQPDAAQRVTAESTMNAAGIDYRDIARIVGKSPDSVRMKLKRSGSN